MSPGIVIIAPMNVRYRGQTGHGQRRASLSVHWISGRDSVAAAGGLFNVRMNLIVNAIQAMSVTDDGPRELLISTEAMEDEGVRVRVQDTGPGRAQRAFPVSLTHFTQRRQAVSVWGWQSVSRLSKRMVDVCGRLRASQEGPFSNLKFLPIKAQRRDRVLKAEVIIAPINVRFSGPQQT